VTAPAYTGLTRAQIAGRKGAWNRKVNRYERRAYALLDIARRAKRSGNPDYPRYAAFAREVWRDARAARSTLRSMAGAA